jgi:hypothetical protein
LGCCSKPGCCCDLRWFAVLAFVLLSNQCSYIPCRQVPPEFTAAGWPAHCPGSGPARHRQSRWARPSPCQAGGKEDAEGWLGVRKGDGDGGDGEGVGSEGWRSKVRVEPATPAAKVASFYPPSPAAGALTSANASASEQILFRRLLSQKCELRVEPAQLPRSPPSLLNALALRRSDRSDQFHPPLHEYGLVPPAHRGTGRPTRGAARPAHEKTERSAHEETRWRTVQEFKHWTTICVYRAMRRSRPAAPRMAPRLQQEELSHLACRFQGTGHLRRRVGEEAATRVREKQERVSPHLA